MITIKNDMKEIKLQSISILNFKGIRNLEITFNTEGMTTISGRNATGKSTVRDAFLWLMFDKNSSGDKEFGIKTNDENGNPIPQIPHEVSAVVLMCEEGRVTSVRLRKCLVEKWVKKSGEMEKRYSGNTTEYYVNDVPKKASEYNSYIKELCDETVFRTITSPSYLPEMNRDKLRTFLFSMAGELSDADIASGDSELERLMGLISGKSIDGLKEQIRNEKSRIKKEIDDIPSRIEECYRMMPENKDWEAIQAEIDSHKVKVADIESQIEDVSKAMTAENEHRMRLSSELSGKKMEYSRLSDEITQKGMKEYYDKLNNKREIHSSVERIESEIQGFNAQIKNLEREKESLEGYVSSKNEEISVLRREWNEINSQNIRFNEDDFVCPTCKRLLDTEDIEERKSEMISNFNKRKAEELSANQKKGIEIKSAIEESEKRISLLSIQIKNIKEKVGDAENKKNVITGNPLYSAPVEQPDVSSLLAGSLVLASIQTEIDNLECQLEQPVSIPQTDELKQERQELQSLISMLEYQLSRRELIKMLETRIHELNNRLRDLSQLLAEKEQTESWIDKFNKRKVDMVEERINSMFSMVKWKMYKHLINGGEEPTCVPIIGNAEYRDANAAGKLNGGLDIINAVCQYYGVYAPIFIDNAEGVNNILPTHSQMIRLVVTCEPKLTVSYE